MNLHSASEAALLADVPASTVRWRANKLELGRKVGGRWVFTDEDVERLREDLPRGNPNWGTKVPAAPVKLEPELAEPKLEPELAEPELVQLTPEPEQQEVKYEWVYE